MKIKSGFGKDLSENY